MLAKPEYSSPPDEVCCWLGRRDRAVAGRGAATKSHREDAGGGAAAKSHREAVAGWGAVAKNHRKETRRLRKRRRTGKYLLLRWNQGAVVAQAAGVAPV